MHSCSEIFTVLLTLTGVGTGTGLQYTNGNWQKDVSVKVGSDTAQTQASKTARMRVMQVQMQGCQAVMSGPMQELKLIFTQRCHQLVVLLLMPGAVAAPGHTTA
jgi:hypothetical protein